MKIDKLQFVDSRDKKMPRKGQADVRLIYVGFNDLDRKNRVIDFYPIDGDVVWQMDWRTSPLTVSQGRQELISETIAPFRNLPYEKRAETIVATPCINDGCDGTTMQTVNFISTFEEKTERMLDAEASNREKKPVYKAIHHEFLSEMLCATCRGENRSLIRWEQFCPRKFREGDTKTNTAFFPKIAWEAVQQWAQNVKHSDRSLYICGDTGVCKSRMMFQMLRDHIVPAGFSFSVYAGGEFRREQEMIMATRFDRKGDRITSNADDVDVLVFDDFCQDDLNPSMLSNLRLLIDKRLSNGLRTIFLANVPPHNIVNVYGDNMATKTLVRRILDYCDVVEVRATKQMMDARIESLRSQHTQLQVEDIPDDESPF